LIRLIKASQNNLLGIFDNIANLFDALGCERDFGIQPLYDGNNPLNAAK
jgi:hypothetical protein